MANILGLALKVTGDASGLAKSLTPVDRALDSLAKQAEKATAVFAPFAEKTAAAAKSQEDFAARIANLAQQLKDKVIGPQEYAAAFGQLTEEAKAAAKAFEEGLRLTESNRTAEEKRAAALQRLDELYALGAIDLRVYNAEAIKAIGVNEQIAKAEAERAEMGRRAAAIIESNMTTMERAERDFTAGAAEANRLRQAGLLTDQEHARQVQKLADAYAKATIQANKLGKETENAAKQGLKFNEITGILSALPGPIGNVAGRLSGLASAGEGLSRVFTGGLSSGLRGIGATIAGLVTPFTAGLAAVTGFAVGAGKVSTNLVRLEQDVERLGQLADRLGVSFRFIQVLQTAAQQTGASVESLSGSFTKFLRAINDARDGAKTTVGAFKDLGISQDAVRASNPEKLFTETAVALSRMADPAQRAATAVALFGKSGAELLPVFNQLGQAAADLDRIGGALTDQQRADIDRFGNALDRLGVASAGLKNQISASFAGIGESIANSTAESIGSINRLIKSLDDTASDKTFFGFQKTQARLAADAVLIKQRNAAIAETQRFASQTALAEFVAALGQSNDQAINLTGEIAKAQQQAAAFGNAGSDAVMQLVKSLEDVAAAAEDAGLSEEQLAEAQKRSFADFGKVIDLLKQKQEVQSQATEASRRASEQEVEASARTIAGIRSQLNQAIDDSLKFGQAGFDAARKYQDAVVDLERQFEKRIINETTLKQNAAAVAAEYQKQVDGFIRIAELQSGIVEADRQRLQALLASVEDTTKAEQDIQAVIREQARLEEQIRKQRLAGNAFAADAAAARLAQLDQLQARLDDKQQAVEQGFAEGFTKAFDATSKSIDGLIGKAEQFGNVGAMAAEALRQGIASAQQQASDGILTKETYDREVARQQELFNQRLAAAQRVEEFLRQQLDERQRAELDAVKALEDRKKQAEINIQTIKAKLIEQEQALAKAREDGDLKAAKAAKARIDQLNQAQRGEQALLNGQQGAARVQAQVVSDSAARAQQFQQLITQQNTSFANAVQGSVNAANTAISKVAEINDKQNAFLRQLNTLGPQAVQTADIRTQQGAALVIGLATEAQDPALIEARLQTKALKAIRDAIVEGTNFAPVPVRI